MFGVAADALVDARNQIHWASQLLGAVADVKLERMEDDSQSNLAWNDSKSALEGRTGVFLGVADFNLQVGSDHFSLPQKTLEDARVWLATKLGTEIKLRNYDMPDHPVRSGAVFSAGADERRAISDWLTFASKVLQGTGELRVWPHHFDLGFWVSGNVEGRSIGGGFSVGDHFYERPYFYLNPYGVERPETLPELPHGGFWTEHWFGAVITSDELTSENAESKARDFMRTSIEAAEKLLAD